MSNRSQFALMLNHAPDRYDGLSEDEVMAIIGDYVAWVEEMTREGRYVSGHKLETLPGRVVSRKGDVIDVHEGPFAELPEVLGGFMIIEAENVDEAVELARNHPHLRHNESMEIRALDPDA